MTRATTAYAAWSPDGNAGRLGGGRGGRARDLGHGSAGGGASRRLTTGADDSAELVVERPDRLRAARGAGSRSGSWTRPVAVPRHGSPRPTAAVATRPGRPMADGSRSPAGRVASNRIFVVDADGQTDLVELTPSRSCDCDEPAWSPDGSQVVYVGPGRRRDPPDHARRQRRWVATADHDERSRPVVGELRPGHGAAFRNLGVNLSAGSRGRTT